MEFLCCMDEGFYVASFMLGRHLNSLRCGMNRMVTGLRSVH